MGKLNEFEYSVLASWPTITSKRKRHSKRAKKKSDRTPRKWKSQKKNKPKTQQKRNEQQKDRIALERNFDRDKKKHTRAKAISNNIVCAMRSQSEKLKIDMAIWFGGKIDWMIYSFIHKYLPIAHFVREDCFVSQSVSQSAITIV